MYRVPISFHNRLMRGEIPLAYVVIQTHLGYRAYAEKELSDYFGILRLLANGSVVGDGSQIAGADSDCVMEKSARVINIGSFERTLQSRSANMLTAFYGKQQQHISVSLDNVDFYFSRLIVHEPFLTRPIWIYVGFDNTPQSEHLSLFKGVISENSIADTEFTLEADER